MADTAALLTSFRFEVSLLLSPEVVAARQPQPGAEEDSGTPSGVDKLGTGGFQECSGLEIEMDVQEYQEGGNNNAVVRRVGRAKYPPLVLKRGMFFGSDGAANGDLWGWMQSVLNGERPVARYDGVIHVMGADNEIRATWTFDRGLPSKIKGPELNAKTGEVAIEELTILHEGLRLMPAGAAS
jgi:phage tail-like protein